MPVPVIKVQKPVTPANNNQPQAQGSKPANASSQVAIKPGQAGSMTNRPGLGTEPIIPALPNTKEAESVVVYGIIDFPEYPVAIIQTGNEPVAQSVTARTTLRDPLKPSEVVAVESIQGNTVSLGQNGQTILKQVGEESKTMTKTGVTPQ